MSEDHSDHDTESSKSDTDDEADKRTLPHKGSVYTYFMIVVPLEQRKHGHACTWKVCLAIALVTVSFVLQLSLTLIASQQIREDSSSFKHSVIMGVPDFALLRVSEIGKEGQQVAADVEKRLRQHLPLRHPRDNMLSTDEDGSETGCCIGAECFSAGRACCAPNVSSSGLQAKSASHHSIQKKRAGALFSREGGSISLQITKPSAKQDSGGNRGREEESHGDAICTNHNEASIDCLPPLASIVWSWHDLDVDGDGTWTLEEAERDLHNQGCVFRVPLEDAFRAACRGIIADAASAQHRQTPGVPLVIQNFEAIPKEFFEWWRGLVRLCMATDPALCPRIVRTGMFDGLLNKTRSSMDLDAVTTYCQRLISPSGICDAALPGLYVMYRSRLQETCGVASYIRGPRYTNPFASHDVMETLDVSYETLDSFRLTHEMRFLFFLFLIIVLWFLYLIEEFTDILSTWDFLWNFPVVNDESMFTPNFSRRVSSFRNLAASSLGISGLSGDMRRRKGSKRGLEKLVIRDFTRPFYVSCIIMHGLRSLLFWYLFAAGTYFLLSNKTYIDLLLNSVALAFVFDVDEFIYNYLVPEDMQSTMQNVKPLLYTPTLPSAGFGGLLFQKYIIGLIFVPVFAGICVCEYNVWQIAPVLEALECACLQSGSRCSSVGLIDSTWWNGHWEHMSKLP